MRLRCAVLDDFQKVATEVADWSLVADDVEVVAFDRHIEGEDALAAALAGFDIVVTLRERVPFPGSLIARLPRLKLLVASGMRNSVIDHAAAEAHGVTVCGTASSSTPPVELTWALLLGLARGIVEESSALRSGGPWQSTVGADLHGRRLGLLGLGKIGSRVAQVGLAFGMHVSAWSQNLTRERTDEIGVELAPSKEDLLASSDFVSVHLALSDRTRGLLGPAELAHRRPGGPPRRPARGRDRRRRRRRLRHRAAARRPPDARGSSPPRHPAPRLRLPSQLRDVLWPGGREHPGLSGRFAHTAPGSLRRAAW
jgi:phosphoglycerate dehydrogenase-like enzyme